MKSVILFLIAVTYVKVARGQSNYEMLLYDQLGSSGSLLLVNNYVPDLGPKSFNDITSSICVKNGIWLLYENPNYNSQVPGLSAYYWAEKSEKLFCLDLPTSFNNKLTSVRYAGTPFDFKTDAINIYQGNWYQAGEDYATNDSPNLKGYAGSLVVTGRSSWTLYDSPNYTGYTVCVTTSDATNAYPGFYPQASDFGFSNRLIRSARRGCFGSRKIIWPSHRNVEPGVIHYSTNGFSNANAL